MAFVRSFSEKPSAQASFRSETDCGYRIVDFRGQTVLHLETYGSAGRQIPGKVSQSLQLDEDAARELHGLIERAFPHLGR